MKISILFLVGVMCSPFAGSSLAWGGSAESQLLFSLNAQGKIRLGIINTSRQTLNIEVLDKNGSILFEDRTKSGNNYFKILDLCKLDDGDYQVRLTGLKIEICRSFSVFKSQIKIASKKNETESKNEPQFKVIDNKSVIVYYNNTEASQVRIDIELNNEPVFQDVDIKDVNIVRKYSLVKLPAGEYVIRVYAGDHSYSYPIAVK